MISAYNLATQIHPTKYAMILNHTTKKLSIIEFNNLYHLLDDVLTRYGHQASIFRIYDYRPDTEEIKHIQDKIFIHSSRKKAVSITDKYMNIETKGGHIDQPIRFNEMARDKRNDVVVWLKTILSKRKTRNTKIGNSLTLKERFDNREADHMTNGEIKGAMIVAGFYPTRKRDQNPYYKIKLNPKYKESFTMEV